MLREQMYFNDLLYRLDSLILYRGINEDIVIKRLQELAKAVVTGSNDNDALTRTYYSFLSTIVEIAERDGLRGNVLEKHVVNLFLENKNAFSLLCEKNANVKNLAIYKIVFSDIKTLKFLMEFDVKNICESLGHGENIWSYVPATPKEQGVSEQIKINNSVEQILDSLVWSYSHFGCGELAQYKTFQYDENEGLVGIKEGDTVTFNDLIGYEYQKEEIVANTEAFIKGANARNILLVGGRGTGKSSFVRALINKYFDAGLRIIEINQSQIKSLPKILTEIANRGKKFIIFLDELSLAEFEEEYKNLKSVLEGSTGARTGNALLYVTSDDEEFHTTFDSFGVTIAFPKQTEDQYLNIVFALAKKRNLSIGQDFLKEQALKWGTAQKGFSGRNAKQFVDHIIWELGKQ